ncbi:MAG TPA: F0F1 ATP synthase subunit epsilon [Candidatus Paceibacterota bacterium]|nr:F0F1 ATP synthase subunit epsilon [Candidatus Paceibacterota bacterium]
MAEHGTFHLVIASVGENLFDGAALAATIPTNTGEITVLPHHEPLVVTLKQGTVRVKTNTEEKKFTIAGGVLEVSNNRAVVLL